MGRYFKQSKFTSFTRKLNRWGFERVARGPETGAYYHPLFQRNNLRLCLQMTCQGTKAHYQQKDHSENQETEDAATHVMSNDGIMNRLAVTESTIQEPVQEPQMVRRDPAFQDRSSDLPSDGVINSAYANPEANLQQIGRLEGVIEQTLLKHHLANQAAADTAALGVSRQGLLDALVGGMRSTTAAPSNQGSSLLQQMQLEEAQRKFPSNPLANLATAEASSIGAAGRELATGLGDFRTPSFPFFSGGNTTSHLQLRQLEDIWRMLRQQPISIPGSSNPAHMPTLGTAGLMGTSALATAGLSDSNSFGPTSHNTGGLNASQLEEARRQIILQQQIQLAQQSMIAAIRPTLGNASSSISSQRFPSAAADPASALLGGMLPSTTSSDFLSVIMAQEAAQRQIREALGTAQQGNLQPDNRLLQEDRLNQQILQLVQQANSRHGIGQQQEQRHPGGDEEKHNN